MFYIWKNIERKKKKPSSSVAFSFVHSPNGVHCWWVGEENEKQEEEKEVGKKRSRINNN